MESWVGGWMDGGVDGWRVEWVGGWLDGELGWWMES